MSSLVLDIFLPSISIAIGQYNHFKGKEKEL